MKTILKINFRRENLKLGPAIKKEASVLQIFRCLSVTYLDFLKFQQQQQQQKTYFSRGFLKYLVGA